jgi:MYXO-CTERM domain-containing protein
MFDQSLDGETDVPLNVRFLVHVAWDLDEGDFLLERQDDPQNVELTMTTLREVDGAWRVYVFTPTDLLVPDTEYFLRGETTAAGSFRTGDWMAEAPEPPEESDRGGRYERGPRTENGRQLHAGFNCGDGAEAFEWRLFPGDRMLRLLSFDGDDTVLGALDGEVQVISEQEYTVIGDGPCHDNWAGAGPGATAPLHAATLDRWGQVSTWSALDDVAIPGRCSVGGSPSGGGVLVLVLFFRRRRRQ